VLELFAGVSEPERGQPEYELLHELWLQAENLRDQVDSLAYGHYNHRDREERFALLRQQALELGYEYARAQDDLREE
jgi:hypothetical protein